MGYIRHDAIIVTDLSFGDKLDEAHGFASAAGAVVSEISPRVVNGFRSFCVFPDGSKEGWDTSDDADGIRNEIVAKLDELGLDYAEVSFGGDDPQLAHLKRHSQ